jgi:hypothetical protein
MKLTEVKVSAGRTFNHPFEQYSNLRCDVHLGAVVEDGEDGLACAKELQAKAEELAENHKQDLLKNIRDLQRIARANEEISHLEERMKQADERLKELRRSVSAYQGGPLRLTGSDREDESENDAQF